MRISGGEWKAIRPGLREVYRQCRRRMRTALSQGDDEAFHKWRIRVKNLFYELQTLQPVWPERLEKMVAGLRQLETEIGADHDIVVLKRSLRKTPDAFGGAETVAQVVGPLDEKSRKLRREVEPLGKAIFDQTSRRFVRELGQHWSKWRKVK
jgi:CHAD domain-containing protein